MVLPCNNNRLRAEVQKRPYTRVGRFDVLNYDVEQAMASILEYELSLIHRVRTLISELEKQPDYTVFAAFRTIDTYNEGKIHDGNLQEFFRSYGLYYIDEEIYAILRRIDTDGDAKLCFDEFADFFKVQVNTNTPLTKPNLKQ